MFLTTESTNCLAVLAYVLVLSLLDYSQFDKKFLSVGDIEAIIQRVSAALAESMISLCKVTPSSHRNFCPFAAFKANKTW